MKFFLLLPIIVGCSISGFSQNTQIHEMKTAYPCNAPLSRSSNVHSTERTTASYDTVIMQNTTGADSPKIYYIIGASGANDSGYISGYNGFGFNGFAERYDFNGADSSVQIIGVWTLFGGTVNPLSHRTITLKAWTAGPETALAHPKYFYSGLPDTLLDSVIVPITQLGIGAAHAPDTFKLFPLLPATSYLTKSFFVGYTANYDFSTLSGDTIALFTTKQYQRISPPYTTSGTDTIVNDQNVSLKGGAWGDNALQLGLYIDYYIYPLVIVMKTLDVNGITNNNFTFFGNYPNPAVNSTNIKFSLAKATDVIVQIMDVSGRLINTIKQNDLTAGEHIIPVQTTDMPAGDYIYIIHTSEMDGIASKMTVIK